VASSIEIVLLSIVDTVAYQAAAGLAIRYRIAGETGLLTIATQTDARAEVWIAAGFAELARSGVEGVRVEVLAKNLGVTKGGFYRRFRDRAALLEAMLASWSERRIAAIEAQTSLDGITARERLRALIRLYSERMNTDAMAIELAIRQWARTDEKAAAAVASVDAARLKNVGQLYRAAGLAGEEADAQAFLFYSFIFGQSLLFLEKGQRRRAQLVAKSAGKLVEDEK
jgi:AcrR family transcriptional regulator